MCFLILLVDVHVCFKSSKCKYCVSAGLKGESNPHFAGETLINSRAVRAHGTGSRHIFLALLACKHMCVMDMVPSGSQHFT